MLGRQISIAPADIEQKLVKGGRGGYCFEHNNLLRMVRFKTRGVSREFPVISFGDLPFILGADFR